MDRRAFLVTTAVLSTSARNLLAGAAGRAPAPQEESRQDAAVIQAGADAGATQGGKVAHELPALPYAFDALEPYIDAKTMEIHHGKHHAAYVNNLNKALESAANLQGKPLTELVANLDAVPEAVRTAVRNNGGGHWNHSMFWKIMRKGGGGEPRGPLADDIKASFGSFAEFKTKLNTAAMTRFGSGWAWLYSDKNGKLVVDSTPNQDNPIMSGGKPVMGLDVWEHAYYLKYQNRRNEYVEAWWNTLNWDEIAANYEMAKK